MAAAAWLPRAPKFNGSSLRFSLVMLELISALSVFSIDASATTFTSSASAPIFSLASTRALWATKMRMPSWRNRPNPWSSTLRL